MKKIIFIFLSILILSYSIETTKLSNFPNYKPTLAIASTTDTYELTWTSLPYPVFYEIEIHTSPPSNTNNHQTEPQKPIRYFTWQNKYTLDKDLPKLSYLRVSAHGLFKQPIGSYSNTIAIATNHNDMARPLKEAKPIPHSFFSRVKPASFHPMLTWQPIQGGVYYEFEITSEPPENPNGILPSVHQVFSTRQVYTNGYNPNLYNFDGDHFYWRVRALDFDGNPMGVFSDAAEIFVDRSIQEPFKPLLISTLSTGDKPVPLFPVYSWIPISDINNYEVELTTLPPEAPNNTVPSRYRIWSKRITGFDCYDDLARIKPGTYYWRVRGIDAAGHTVGVYSDAEPVTVDLSQGNYAATLGDSITHGGGAVSYAPSDLEYDYQTYLNFPVVNLGKSGDTAGDTLARFEADVLPFKPKYLIIMTGSNSLRGESSAEQVISELKGIGDKCNIYGIRPIYLTLPPINPASIYKVFQEETAPDWREKFDNVNEFIRQQPYQIDIEPYFNDTLRQMPDRYAIDGLHPDIPGKKLMARIINENWERVTK
jgi:lysophospholipase L1-like esterase